VEVTGQQHSPAALTPREFPGTHWIAGWVGPIFSLNILEKRKSWCLCRDSNPKLSRRCNHKGTMFWFTYLLTPWSRVLLEKLTGLQLVKKFPAFYGTRRFVTALISARHLSLSWASSIQSTHPHPTSRRSVLILSSHLRLGLPSGLLPSGFPHHTPVQTSPLPHTRYMPSHIILLDFVTCTILGEEYRL
jgi:hypothetical protein